MFFVTRGHALNDLGRLSEAQEAYSTAHRLDPAYRLNLGFLAEAVGQEMAKNRPPSGDSAPSWAFRDLQRRLEAAITSTNKRIRVANHGVRRKDALAMLLPLGFDVTTIDSDLIRDLDECGSQRGQIAHASARTVKNQPDPADAKTKADGLLNRLEQLDFAIASLP